MPLIAHPCHSAILHGKGDTPNDSPAIKALGGASAVLLMAKTHHWLLTFLFVSIVHYSNPIHFSPCLVFVLTIV